MAEPRGGGFVLSLRTHTNFVGRMNVNQDILQKVVEALGIPQRAPGIRVAEHYDDIETIYIFRGAAPKK